MLLCMGGAIAVAQKQAGLLSYTSSAGKKSVISTKPEWEIKRAWILSNMEMVMGKLPERAHLPPMNIQFIDSVRETNYTRYKISFTAAENETVIAYLYVPVQTAGLKKLPAMLALHPTGGGGKKIADGQGNLQNRAYAKELADRGYVVIAPDYPGFGDAKDYDYKADRYQSGTMKSIFDNMRCIDLLQSRPDVDPKNIGVIGHSLGGHGAIFTAAFDTRLKVAVSSCGWTPMHHYFNGDSLAAQKYGGKLWPWAKETYMPLIQTQYGLDPDRLPFDFDEVIAAIAPRSFFSVSPVNDANFDVNGVKEGIVNIEGVYSFLNVPGNLQVRYPDSRHDFPPTARWQAYQFIDKAFGFDPAAIHYSYLDNYKYYDRTEEFEIQKDPKKIVMLGNSITERGQWENILGRTDVANRGIGSDITGGYINRLHYVFNLKPGICFIEGGVNDLGRGISQQTIIRNLAMIIDTLRREHIIPVLNTVTYLADNYKSHDPKAFNDRIKSLNREIRMLAKRKKVKLIDLNPKISDRSFLIKKYAIEDGIHYTAETYSLWGKEIIKVLDELNAGKY